MKALEELIRDIADRSKVTQDSLNVTKAALVDLQQRNRTEFNSHLQNADLSSVFLVLADLSSDLIPVYCDVIAILLDSIPAQVVLTKYEHFIARVLGSDPHHSVHTLAVQQLSRCVRDAKVLPTLIANRSLLALIIDCMKSSTMHAQVKGLLLQMTEHSKEAVKTLFDAESLKMFEQVQKAGSMEKVRVFELYCEVACQSEENCSSMTPRLKTLIDSLRAEKSDVIVMINYVELLRTLVKKPYTLKFLLASDGISVIRDLLLKPDNQNATLYMPEVVLFFGDFGLHSPAVLIRDFTPAVRAVLSSCRSSPWAPAAIAAVGQIARSVEGKRLLEAHLSSEIKEFMPLLGSFLDSSQRPTEFKVSALNAVTAILEMEEFDQLDVIALTSKWFSLISANPFQLLWKCSKVPFEAERLAGLRTLRNVALLPWGRAKLLTLAGFYEWLLDRNTEPEKAGKEAKHAIVAALLEEANSIGDATQVAGLRKFFAEGPFYSPPEVTVATRGT